MYIYICLEAEVTYIYVLQSSMSNIYLQEVLLIGFNISIPGKISSLLDTERKIVWIMWNFANCEGANHSF